MCLCEWDISVHCDHAFPLTAMIYVVLQLFGVSRQNVGLESGVIRHAPARVLIAHAFKDAQCGDDERMMQRDRGSERRIEDVTAVGEKMCKSISASFNSIERLPLTMNMNDNQFPSGVSGNYQRVKRRPVDTGSATLPGSPE